MSLCLVCLTANNLQTVTEIHWLKESCQRVFFPF